jgi:hypothetical protein
MSTPRLPRVTAAAVASAAARLFGTVVLDLADMMVGPALYDARLGVFRTLDGDDLGDDDGSLIVLVTPGEVDTLAADLGSPAAAARALTAEARRIAGAA